MKKIFFTPGPTQLYPSVAGYLQQALQDDLMSISHRCKDFEAIFSKAESNIKKLLNAPETSKVLFLAAGTEAMERIVQNCSVRSTFHFINGAFSQKFFEIAKQLGREVQHHTVEEGQGYDPTKTKIGSEVELVCITHNETSTGVWIDEALIAEFKRKNPDVLLAVDLVSSAPLAKLDLSLVDICFFSSQKCFGLPSGFGAMILSQAAIEKQQSLKLQKGGAGSYHSFSELLKYNAKHQTPATPNVLGIYLLGCVAEEMLKEGIERIRQTISDRAAMLYKKFEGGKALWPFVQQPYRSKSVLVFNSKEPASSLIKDLSQKGIVVGSGYGKAKDHQIRIANFPSHTEADMTRLLSALST